jgi:hypothetical protein
MTRGAVAGGRGGENVGAVAGAGAGAGAGSGARGRAYAGSRTGMAGTMPMADPQLVQNRSPLAGAPQVAQ